MDFRGAGGRQGLPPVPASGHRQRQRGRVHQQRTAEMVPKSGHHVHPLHRPYRKNDNCHVEQKNNSHVRNFVGYRRFSGAGELGALAGVYRSLCPLLNYFIPTRKLLSKTRVGAKVKKVYDKNILTPYQRLMLSTDLSDEAKAELARRMGLHDPVRLQREVHDAVAALMELNGKRNLEDTEALALSALQAL